MRNGGYSRYGVISFLLMALFILSFFSSLLFGIPNYPSPNSFGMLVTLIVNNALTFCIASLVFGGISLSEIKRKGLKGKWMTITGLTLSFIVLLALLLMLLSEVLIADQGYALL